MFKGIIRAIFWLLSKPLDIIKNIVFPLLFIIIALIYGIISNVLSVFLNIHLDDTKIISKFSKFDSYDIVDDDDYFVNKVSHLLDLVFKD